MPIWKKSVNLADAPHMFKVNIISIVYSYCLYLPKPIVMGKIWQKVSV